MAGVAAASPGFDHPIFSESIRLIRAALAEKPLALGLDLDSLELPEQDVALRLIHSSGDLSLAADLRFSAQACCCLFYPSDPSDLLHVVAYVLCRLIFTTHDI